MISICSTIHGSPKACEAFIRSIYDNATGEDFEVRLVLDRSSTEETALLEDLATSKYPRLYTAKLSKEDRIKGILGLMGFWNAVYGEEIALYAEKQLLRYERGEIDPWMQYALGLNIAAYRAKGDMILLTPADFVVLCDVHALGKVCSEHAASHNGRFFGNFGVVAPLVRQGARFEDCYTQHRMATGYSVVLEHLLRNHLMSDDYPVTPGIDRYWPFNHGVRVVDRQTFIDVGGLQAGFLTKTGPTDIFNHMARATVYGTDQCRVKKSIQMQTGFRARMASVPFDDGPPIEYLYPNHCDERVVRKMRITENKWLRDHEPEWKEIF